MTTSKPNTNRLPWLIAGLGLGLCVSWMWPHEPMHAATVDRDEKFAMITVPVKDVQFAGVKDSLDGIFVLDFLTGQLRGAVLDPRSGQFSTAYLRSVASDFQVDPNATARYAVTTGVANLPNQGRVQMSSGVIYVGELNSGMVMAYGFPYSDNQRSATPIPMIPLNQGFVFRAAQ